MDLQKQFQAFHKNIKVETEELREKRDILVNKIKASLKEQGHPVPEPLNQGSYIYGVGVVPTKNEEYDIDVGLDFDILSDEHSAKEVRDWVFAAIKDHTDKVKSRGPCIRVHYAAGYHVDLVIYARHRNNENVIEYRLATKDDQWKPTDPKKMKKFIIDARKPFENTKDSSGSDQLQRVTRYLKRWNDLDIPGDSPDKPFGLATLLLVINYLKSPVTKMDGTSDDVAALSQIANYVKNTFGRISIKKPTPEYEDVFAKLSTDAMTKLTNRFKNLYDDLQKTKNSSDEEEIYKLMQKHFGDDFPSSLKKAEAMLTGAMDSKDNLVKDMKAAIPSASNPSQPWTKN